jgi:hypothetical protein
VVALGEDATESCSSPISPARMPANKCKPAPIITGIAAVEAKIAVDGPLR